MKKGMIIALIVAVALIITGGIILVLGLSFAGNNTQKSELIRKDITIQERFDTIAVDTADCDVKFAMFSGRDDCMVELYSFKNVEHTAVVEDGTLKIKMIDKRNWTDHISFGRTESMEMTVYLPEKAYGLLRVTTNTGDIAVPDTLTFASVELFSDTGAIGCVAAVTDRITAGTDTGDILVMGSAPTTLNIRSNTGDVELTNMDCGDCMVKTDTGEIGIENLYGQSLDCTSDTGEVEMELVIAMEYLKVISDTGDVELTECDAPSITVQTNTGDISGVLLSPKEFFAKTNTGKERIADHSGAVTGQCYITSDTGDITFGYTK